MSTFRQFPLFVCLFLFPRDFAQLLVIRVKEGKTLSTERNLLISQLDQAGLSFSLKIGLLWKTIPCFPKHFLPTGIHKSKPMSEIETIS